MICAIDGWVLGGVQIGVLAQVLFGVLFGVLFEVLVTVRAGSGTQFGGTFFLGGAWWRHGRIFRACSLGVLGAFVRWG